MNKLSKSTMKVDSRKPKPKNKSAQANALRENEKFIAGKIVNKILGVFGDANTKKLVGEIEAEDIPNTVSQVFKKAMGASNPTKKAKGGMVKKPAVKKKAGGMVKKTTRAKKTT